MNERLTETHQKNIEKPMVFQSFHVQNSFIYKGILNMKLLKNHWFFNVFLMSLRESLDHNTFIL